MPRRWRTPLALAAIAAAVLAFWLSPLREAVDPERVATWLRSIRAVWWAPLAFIGAYTIFNVFLVPGTILTLTAGAVWGWWTGGLWVLAASTIGSAAPYFLARSGSAGVTEALRARAARLAALLQDQGFTTLLLLRLVPIVPYNLLNYAAGFAGVKPRAYFAATFLGTIPGIFVFTYSADAIAAGVIRPRDAFIRIVLAGLAFGALILITRRWSGRVRARLERRG